MADESTKVPFELLDVDNYEEWAARMEAFLIWRGLWATIETPESTTADQQRKTMACLLLHVKRQHISTFKTCTTPREAWDKLKGIFVANSQERQHQLRTELSNLRINPGESVVSYCSRARDLYTNLVLAGGTIPESDVALSILRGLPAEYNMVATVLRTTGGAQTIDGVLNKLLPVEYDVHDIKVDLGQSHALMSRLQHKHHREVECWHCHKKGHIKRDCPSRRAHAGVAQVAMVL